MKKIFKWIFIVILVIIFGIDIMGLYKYKLKKNSNQVVANPEIIQEPENQEPYASIEYADLTSSDFKNSEKLFITDIESNEIGQYTIKGIIFEEYTVTKEEYNKIKNGTSVKILNKEYKKDTIKSNNLNLKSTEEDAYDLYITYDNKNKKYVIKDKTTDYSVYKPTEKYVKLVVNENLTFIEEKNGRSVENTVKDIAESHKNLLIPENALKINICTLTFDKNGKCKKITEIYM